MLLLALALGGLGLWYWSRLRKSGRKVPAAWLGIAGTLIGTMMIARGMPMIGGLLATGSGLWLRFGGSLPGMKPTPDEPAPSRAELSLLDAADLLGVPVDASREDIHAAYRKLMARNHPDAGGSAGLAARINAARDLLLKAQNR